MNDAPLLPCPSCHECAMWKYSGVSICGACEFEMPNEAFDALADATRELDGLLKANDTALKWNTALRVELKELRALTTKALDEAVSKTRELAEGDER